MRTLSRVRTLMRPAAIGQDSSNYPPRFDDGWCPGEMTGNGALLAAVFLA